MGMAILRHSIGLVLNNLNAALRISAVLYFGPAVVLLLVMAVMGVPSPQNMGAVGVLTGLIALVAAIGILWIAVAWHRYVLLDELPDGPIPPFRGDSMLRYFGYSLLIGLISLVAVVVVGLVGTPLIAMTGGFLPIALLVALATIFVVLIINYRLSAVLPGTAVGKPVSLGEAWRATANANGALIGLAILSAIVAVAIDIPAYLLNYGGGVGMLLGQVWTTGTGWLKLMVGVSILTTLYGHFIEGRALPN